jgi:hypothetical protein
MPSDVRAALELGETIEAYLDDQPRPSRLVLGWSRKTPLHVVAADDPSEQRVIVITVYVPDPQQWGPDLKTRGPR